MHLDQFKHYRLPVGPDPRLVAVEGEGVATSATVKCSGKRQTAWSRLQFHLALAHNYSILIHVGLVASVEVQLPEQQSDTV